MFRIPTVVLIAFIVSVSAPAQPAKNRLGLVRIVVLDTSGSMAGERIETARKELLDLGRQLPPSTDNPFIVVPFHHDAHDVKTFTDLKSFEKFIQSIQAGGGTSIAKGLERAIKELAPGRDARHICVLLYTDGEDGDLAGILKQEEILDRLFSDRGKRGLHQSVVFAKRWEQANADLLKKITERGNAQVIDAGELKIQPVVFTPTLSVADVRWAKDQPRVAEITIHGRIEAKGLKPKGSAPVVHAACVTANVQGDVKTPLTANQQTPQAIKLRIPVTPAMVAARKVELVFELSLPLAPDSSKSLVLPLLPVDRITVPATLPSLAVRSSFKTQLTQAKPAHWHDPITLRPAVALTLTVDVKSDSSGPWDDVIAFRISSQPGQRILLGKESFTCKAPGTYTIPFTVEAPALTSVGAKSSPIKVAMMVGPDSAPANHTVEPKDTLVSLEVQPPASVQTKLTTQTKSISAPRWIDVMKATAVFDAEVQFVVDGPLAKDTVITVQCPPAVRNIKFHPATIQSGTQMIRFTIEAEFAPSQAVRPR